MLLQKALIIKKELGNKGGIAGTLHNIGKNYKFQANYIKSLEYLQKSLKLSIEIGDKSIEARNYTELGSVYLKLNKIKEAYNYSYKSYTLAEEIGELNFQKESSEILAKACEILGLYNEAYKYHVIFKSVNDSIYNKDNNKKIAGLEYKYQYEKEIQATELEQQKKDVVRVENQKRQEIIRNFLIIGFTLMVLLVIVVYRNFLQKHKANDILANQKREIEDKNDELFQQNEKIQVQSEEMIIKNNELNQKNEEIETQRDEIVIQKKEIEEAHEHVLSSVNYAQRIQKAMLPTNELFNEYFSEHFILFKPRDIFSGDFYWAKKIDNILIFAAADSTGHGVPGAFVSMLGMSLLNEIVVNNKIRTAGQVLDMLRDAIKTSLKQKDKNSGNKDGMDIALCAINLDTNKLQYAGAYNPLYIIRENQLIELKADRQPIAIYLKEKKFTNHTFNLQKNDVLYVFSDGYIDQFNGLTKKKFKSTQFKKLLTDTANKSLTEQKQILEQSLNQWQGDAKQLDDIVIIGTKIK